MWINVDVYYFEIFSQTKQFIDSLKNHQNSNLLPFACLLFLFYFINSENPGPRVIYALIC